MSETRVELIDNYAIANSTFILRFPVGAPEKEERLTTTFVLYQAANGDFFYYDVRPEMSYPPFAGHKFGSSDEAFEWFSREFRWVRRMLGQDDQSMPDESGPQSDFLERP